MREVELLRRELISLGMRPYKYGLLLSSGRKIEFRSEPWQAGRELFVLIQDVNQPNTARCVGADEVKTIGQFSQRKSFTS